MRKWKRLKAGTCDEENKEIASKKVKGLEKVLKDHLEINKELRRNHYREK
ncbi:putative phage minor capsid protein [Clostridium perfringens F262]|uniref:Phage minor capsid protein n=1 Tax=Clostridium perfringens F262 TaxID=883064 RepID=A0AAV3FCG1_CLOPF|nr:putative phage minor capsid protein [Clostridium perfringens F262]